MAELDRHHRQRFPVGGQQPAKQCWSSFYVEPNLAARVTVRPLDESVRSAARVRPLKRSTSLRISKTVDKLGSVCPQFCSLKLSRLPVSKHKPPLEPSRTTVVGEPTSRSNRSARLAWIHSRPTLRLLNQSIAYQFRQRALAVRASRSMNNLISFHSHFQRALVVVVVQPDRNKCWPGISPACKQRHLPDTAAVVGQFT